MRYQPPNGNAPNTPDSMPRDPQPPLSAPAAPSQPLYPPPPPYPVGYQPPPYAPYPPAGNGAPLYPPPPAAPSQPFYPPPPGYASSMQPLGYGGLGYPAPPDQGAGMATAGLILGLLCIPLSMVPGCGLLFAILGLVLSIQGRKSVRNRSLATAGIVLSSIGLGIFLLQFVGGIVASLR